MEITKLIIFCLDIAFFTLAGCSTCIAIFNLLKNCLYKPNQKEFLKSGYMNVHLWDKLSDLSTMKVTGVYVGGKWNPGLIMEERLHPIQKVLVRYPTVYIESQGAWCSNYSLNCRYLYDNNVLKIVDIDDDWIEITFERKKGKLLTNILKQLDIN
jgi:hypothetical protein